MRAPRRAQAINHQTAIFRQVNKDKLTVHHDALEFPDGRTLLLTLRCEGQTATVLQRPARTVTAAEADAQRRVAYVGLQFGPELFRPPYRATFSRARKTTMRPPRTDGVVKRLS